MELATMYYDFINDYSNMFNVKTFIEKEKIRSDEKTNAVIEILNEYYINGTMFCFLKSDKEKAILQKIRLQERNANNSRTRAAEVMNYQTGDTDNNRVFEERYDAQNSRKPAKKVIVKK